MLLHAILQGCSLGRGGDFLSLLRVKDRPDLVRPLDLDPEQDVGRFRTDAAADDLGPPDGNMHTVRHDKVDVPEQAGAGIPA